MPFWNTRVIHTCGAGTSYHSRTHVLAPHVEHVLFPFRNTRVSPTCEACTAYPSGTHEVALNVEQVLHDLSERTS